MIKIKYDLVLTAYIACYNFNLVKELQERRGVSFMAGEVTYHKSGLCLLVTITPLVCSSPSPLQDTVGDETFH